MSMTNFFLHHLKDIETIHMNNLMFHLKNAEKAIALEGRLIESSSRMGRRVLNIILFGIDEITEEDIKAHVFTSGHRRPLGWL